MERQTNNVQNSSFSHWKTLISVLIERDTSRKIIYVNFQNFSEIFGYTHVAKNFTCHFAPAGVKIKTSKLHSLQNATQSVLV